MAKIQFDKYILAILILVVFLPSVIFAQDYNSSSTAGASTVSNREVKWFKSEFIPNGEKVVGDFVAGPGSVEVTVKPGETVTRIMTLTNRISDKRTFNLTVEDMSGSADPSSAVVLLGDKQGPYTLKDYVSFPSNTLQLDLGERAQIPVSITMPENAEPGGYYGSVLISTVQEDDSANGTVSSPIIARIGTLFFITVPGPVEKSGELKDLSTIPDKFLFSGGPFKFGMLFENTGSVYLNPYGEVRITNTFNKEVGFLEVDPWFVLPQSMRLREFTWDRELLLGRYTVTAKINRGYDDVIDEKIIHIWVIPWQVLAITFGIFFTIIVLIKFVTSRFELKRKK